MNTLRSVKGMHDILADEMPRWHFVEKTYRDLVENFGYTEVRTPIVEPLDLFVRGIGETTDIVEKEMYAFLDKGGINLALRPEGTASAMRAYVQHNVQAEHPQSKWYYLGPMFRRERPAKGRYRQFYQAGAEFIGVAKPSADAEIIDMAFQFVSMLGVGEVTVELNTLGDESTRVSFREALVTYFSKYESDLCVDCQRRLQKNPLRILDCKKTICQQLGNNAPRVLDFLSEEDREHFEELKSLLDHLKTPYVVVPQMVRGLDYYTRTIFEIQVASSALGAQAAIVGGGRYDNLIEQLGGRSTPSIGFSFGLERILMILPDSAEQEKKPLIFVVGIGEKWTQRMFDVAALLRREKHRVDLCYQGGSLRSQLRRAHRSGAKIAIIAGEEEARRGAVMIKDFENGVQEEVPFSDILGRIEAYR